MQHKELDRYLEVLVERKFKEELSPEEKTEAHRELKEHFLHVYNAKILAKFKPAELPIIEKWVDEGNIDKISKLAYNSNINTQVIFAETMAEFQRQYLGDI